jgi:hypothetical protein
MTIKEQIESANTRLANLQQAEFTPEAELCALEAQVAIAKMMWEQTMCPHGISGEDDQCFS